MVTWSTKPFESLKLQELYELLSLRQQVFVVEQRCAFLDSDGVDVRSHHVCGYDENRSLVAYSRLLAPGVLFDEASIGRVATHIASRREGRGRALMQVSIDEIGRLFGNVAIRIGAQMYLERFYGEFGFVRDGQVYYDEGVAHIMMVRVMRP